MNTVSCCFMFLLLKLKIKKNSLFLLLLFNFLTLKRLYNIDKIEQFD